MKGAWPSSTDSLLYRFGAELSPVGEQVEHGLLVVSGGLELAAQRAEDLPIALCAQTARIHSCGFGRDDLVDPVRTYLDLTPPSLGLHRFAVLCAAATFVLIFVGGL